MLAQSTFNTILELQNVEQNKTQLLDAAVHVHVFIDKHVSGVS